MDEARVKIALDGRKGGGTLKSGYKDSNIKFHNREG